MYAIRSYYGPFLFFKAADLRIEIGLDENAQTRVDLVAKARTELV